MSGYNSCLIFIVQTMLRRKIVILWLQGVKGLQNAKKPKPSGNGQSFGHYSEQINALIELQKSFSCLCDYFKAEGAECQAWNYMSDYFHLC